MEHMTTEDLCAYLEKKGLERDDLNAIRDAGFNGRSISVLKRNHYESLYGLRLKHASNLVLQSLLDTIDAPSDYPDGLKLKDCRPCKRLDTVNNTALEATNECQKYAAFGLGRGVDASEPRLLRDGVSLHRVLREVQANNCMRGIKKERHNYEERIESMTKRSHYIKSSVSDLVENVLTFSIEGEYTRQNTMEMKAKGEKIITGSISFRSPLRHRCIVDTPTVDANFQYPAESTTGHTYESNFEHEFCKWFLKEFSDAATQEGDTPEDKVQEYIRMCNSQQNLHSVVEKVYDYIRDQKITHYISAINLGACEYTFGFSKICCRIRNLKAEVGQEILAGVGAGIERNQTRKHNKSNVLCIGDISDVSGKGESVVGYELRPLFTLVCHKHKEIKKVLQMAICYYLKRRNGPFTISCMQHGLSREVYWKVDAHDGKNVVVGTEKESEASIFYIEEQICPNEFNIVYYGEEVGQISSKCQSSQHLSTLSKKMGGRDHGPLQMGGGRAANLTLRHPAHRKEDLTIGFWETDACFIKLAPRRMQRKSYIAFDMDQNKTMVVSCREQDEGNCCMSFSLNRVKIGFCPTKCRVFADFDEAPEMKMHDQQKRVFFQVDSVPEEMSSGDITGEGTRRVACDGDEEVAEGFDKNEDSDFDFEFEFEPASDSDSD